MNAVYEIVHFNNSSELHACTHIEYINAVVVIVWIFSNNIMYYLVIVEFSYLLGCSMAEAQLSKETNPTNNKQIFLLVRIQHEIRARKIFPHLTSPWASKI